MKTTKRIVCSFAVLALLLGLGLVCAAQQDGIDVTYDEILHAASHPSDWVTYGGNYSSQRFSELKQINKQNVNTLKLRWHLPAPANGHLRIFSDRRGRRDVCDRAANHSDGPRCAYREAHLEMDRRSPENLLTIGLFPTNRGVAVLGDTVYVATIDAHLVALDAKTGAMRWSVEIGDNRKAVAITQAPLAINGKIIVGMGGGEGGLRGYIDAYDAKDGKRLWRLYTIPTQDEPGVETWEGDS